jgi:FkbM family methyltransferase
MKLARVCGHSFAPELIQKGGVVLDCGANKGEFSEWLTKYLPGTRVYTFEPDPRLFSALPESQDLRKVHMAVTGDGNDIDLWLGDERCSSAYYKEYDGQQFVRARSTTLDDFFFRERIERVDLIKLDIEGAELDVLTNVSEKCLSRVGQLTIEFHDFLRKSDEARIKECSSRLEGMSFHRTKFSWSDHSDVLFINKRIHQVGWREILELSVKKYKRGIARCVGGAIRKQNSDSADIPGAKFNVGTCKK